MAGASSTKNENFSTAQQNKQDPSKFYSHFLYKVVIVLIFFVIIPLIPSQATEFLNLNLFFTRNWELLHVVLVAIAISYGLFTRRNDETEKENNYKLDNAQNVVSKFLQVSSFFEDEGETENSSSSGFEENKVQTWSNQYHRNESPVVVSSQHSDFDEQSVKNARIGERPLLLPIRSLKSRVSDSTSSDDVVPKRSPSNSDKARNGEKMEENKSKENAVLASPIPWRSRSGKKQVDTATQYASSPKSQTLRSSRSNAMSSSSQSPSSPKGLSSESQAKSTEDFFRKKGFFKSFPPPPPPPPPPIFQKSISMKPRSSSLNEGASFNKELKRSFTSERGIEAKSVRTVRGSQNGNQMEAEEGFMEEPTRKKEGYDYEHVSIRTDKLIGHGSGGPVVSEPVCMNFSEQENFLDKVVVESYEDSETEEDEAGESLSQKEESGESSKAINGGASSSSVSDEGPDVDKKADEFIAKFREQIRLQRIESIKRSARNTRNSSRMS